MGIYICGHSLGGARACQYAFSRLRRSLPVDGVYVFGCPNPGDSILGVFLLPVPHALSLKNRRDLITAVPPTAYILHEEYIQSIPQFTEVNEEWNAEMGLPDWGAFNDHHSQLYSTAALKLPGANGDLSIGEASVEMVRLYDDETGWDWLHPVDGEYWAMKVVRGHQLLIARGTATAHEWVQDFDFAQINVLGARMSRGFWAGVEPVQDEMDKLLAA